MRAPQIGFPQLMQDFFLRRLVAQRGASARTVESYRDAFELLLGFVEQRTGKPPSTLVLADLDAPLVLDFLDHLETVRGNSARTRNARLAAIHSFMRYAAVRDPASLPITARVLAIPAKRFDRPVLGYLTREQVAAILAAPDRGTWSGQRDAVLLATAYNTGARVSELTGLRFRDVLLDRQTAVHLHGKGRKQRAIPLWKNTAAELRAWLDKISPAPEAPVFPNRAGAPLTRSGIRDRLNRAVAIAQQRCPSLHGQARLTPHVASHDGHAPAAIGYRSRRHRVVARTFQPRHHTPVPRSRPRRQGSSPAAPDRSKPPTSTVPPRRPPPRLPARPVIMRSPLTRNHHAQRAPPTGTAHNRELSRIGVMRSCA
ncbi:MAG: tyrosine-type recombinase/integrase [Pseudonocardiaceae bacterium]